MALRIPTDLYKSYKDLNNLEILGIQELYYSYMAFKVGHFDKVKGENITDPNAKMSDVRLRQALVYGLDVEQMVKAFYYGLRERATMAVPPAFKKYYSKDIAGFPYNPEKAKQLLDEAGYKDVNGDGYREDKNGKPFEVRIAAMAGGDIAEPLAQFYIQQWKEIGIKGVLSTGRLIEFNSFYDKVQADDPEIDVFFAAWSVGTNLNPIEGGGRKSPFNFPRFVSDENDNEVYKMIFKLNRNTKNAVIEVSIAGEDRTIPIIIKSVKNENGEILESKNNRIDMKNLLKDTKYSILFSLNGNENYPVEVKIYGDKI